jgi:hypothetical protein
LFGVTRLSIEAGRDDPDLSAGLVSFLLDLLAEQLSTSRFWNIVILSNNQPLDNASRNHDKQTQWYTIQVAACHLARITQLYKRFSHLHSLN